MTKSTRVEHPSYHLDELRSIRMNMKSNTGYVITKPGDRALRSPCDSDKILTTSEHLFCEQIPSFKIPIWILLAKLKVGHVA